MPEPASFTPARSVDEVIERLEAIVEQAKTEEVAWGLFPALYLVTTKAIRKGIRQGNVFEDNARMEKMDVIFANRFLEAFSHFENGRPLTEVWQLYFGISDQFAMYIFLQILLVGMNAHINLDLGIAAAQTAPGDLLPGFKKDFDTINTILNQLTKQIRVEIDELSPRIGLVDRWLKRADDVILRFSLEKARADAWDFAAQLAPVPIENWPPLLAQKDRKTLRFGKVVLRPGFWGTVIVWWIKRAESSDLPRILDRIGNLKH